MSYFLILLISSCFSEIDLIVFGWQQIKSSILILIHLNLLNFPAKSLLLRKLSVNEKLVTIPEFNITAD
jgi:hypothetical protein